MRALLSGIGLTGYFLLCLALFLVGAPRFFYLNLPTAPEFTLEYVTVSGLAFAVFLISVIAAQAVMPKFSAWLVLQVVIVGLSFWFCLYAFDFPPQAELFAFIHVVTCGLFLFVNLRSYHRLSKDEDD